MVMEHQRSHRGNESKNIVEGCDGEEGLMWKSPRLEFLSIRRLSPGGIRLLSDFLMSGIKDKVQRR